MTREKLEGVLIKAALDLFGETSAAAFSVPIPNTTPPLYIIASQAREIPSAAPPPTALTEEALAATTMPMLPRPDRTLYGPDRTVEGHFYTVASVREHGRKCYEAALKRTAPIPPPAAAQEDESAGTMQLTWQRKRLSVPAAASEGLSDARIAEIAFFGSYIERITNTRYWSHEGVQKAIRQAIAESPATPAAAADGRDALDARWRERYEIERQESARWHTSFEHVIKRLSEIHGLMHPPNVEANGKRYSYNPPEHLVREAWEALSKAIRDIPNAIDTALRATGREGAG